MLELCKHNHGVECPVSGRSAFICSQCGFNPAEYKRRVEFLREKFVSRKAPIGTGRRFKIYIKHSRFGAFYR